MDLINPRRGCGIPVFFLVLTAVAVAAFYVDWLRPLFVVAFFGVLLLWAHRDSPGMTGKELDPTRAVLLPNGNLLVPDMRDGVAEPGVLEIGPEHPDYDKWLPFAEEDDDPRLPGLR
jgi:hypothetical protein